MNRDYDFSGWATRSNVRCSDGRIIMPDAFKDCDGTEVPLVWMHRHNDPFTVLGHAALECRNGDVYAYCYFNDTDQGKNAKLLVEHGDVRSMSIFANNLKQNGPNVQHGVIREVSLVLAGANPKAFIDNVVRHSDDGDEEIGADIFFDEPLELSHSDDKKEEKSVAEEKKPEEQTEKKAENKEGKTVADVLNTLTPEQTVAVKHLLGLALESGAGKSESEKKDDKEEDNKSMKHNLFDDETKQENTLSHSEIETIFSDAKRYGTLKESVLQHGIEGLDVLFPEAKAVPGEIQYIQRDMGWVAKVMNGIGHSAFSRIKSIFANITEDEARARGYIKGRYKKEEVFSLLKRSTSPQTVYKRQRLDRDDLIDIVDFDVVAEVKKEMRVMLDEELARAFLIGDGRLASDDDKIREDCIRPIAKDEDLFTIKVAINVAANADDETKAKAFIRGVLKSRKEYKGSGNPTLYATEDIVTDCLLIEDGLGHLLYDSMDKLKNVLRVSDIVTVPVMEGQKGAKGGDLAGIIVNLSDYKVGADKGGAVSLFDDFDIDYNQMKYLIETRCSGALTKPYSAMAIEFVTGA